MTLDELFAQLQQHDTLTIPEGWSQGRTTYGGLVAGLMLQKGMFSLVDTQQQLLSASVTFVGPVSQDAPIRLSVEILRQGKSVTTLEVRLWQEDAVQSILLASFGHARESRIAWSDLPNSPIMRPVEELDMLVPLPVLMPECYQQFQLAWENGQYPCTASKTPDFGGYCRIDPKQHPAQPMTAAHLMTLVDIWPPGVLPMFRRVAPASSLTWHLTYVQPLQQTTEEWLQYQVHTDYAADGYATESAHIWDQHGRLIAICRQTITVFA